MAVYQDKARDRIKKGLRRMTTIVEKGRAEDFKEADTRKIVSDILCEYLGWDRFDNVTAEQMMGHAGKGVGEIHYDRPQWRQFADVVGEAWVRYMAKNN